MCFRQFVFLGLCVAMVGCGSSKPKPPTDAELKAMNEQMQKQMMSMPTLPKKVGNDNDPMKNMQMPGMAAPKK